MNMQTTNLHHRLSMYVDIHFTYPYITKITKYSLQKETHLEAAMDCVNSDVMLCTFFYSSFNNVSVILRRLLC